MTPEGRQEIRDWLAASGGAWIKQALERKEAIARQAIKDQA